MSKKFEPSHDIGSYNDSFTTFDVTLHVIPYLHLHPGHGRAMAERGSVYTGWALPSPNWSTSQRLSRRGSRRGSSVNTQPRRASFFIHMCYMLFKVKFGEGLVRLNVNGIFRQQCMVFRASVNRKARQAMAKLARIILAKAWSGLV